MGQVEFNDLIPKVEGREALAPRKQPRVETQGGRVNFDDLITNGKTDNKAVQEGGASGVIPKPLFNVVSPEKYPALNTVQQAGIAGSKYLNALAFGIPDFALSKTGRFIPEAESKAGKVLSGAAELGGFIGGPIKAAAKLAPKIPVVARVFRPATTLFEATAKPIARSATILGLAEAMKTPEEGGFLNPEERAEKAKQGIMLGTAFGTVGLIPDKALRMITASGLSGIPSTLSNAPIEDQIFNYGLGLFFGRKGGSPRDILRAEKAQIDTIKTGVKNPKKFLEEADRMIGEEKALAENIGTDFIPRDKRFDIMVKKGSTSSLLSLASKTIRKGFGLRWKQTITKDIKSDVAKILKDPKFALETGNMDVMIDYIVKDLGLNTKKIMALDNVKLQSISDALKNYTPERSSPFTQNPPLKAIYADGDWRKKISPWDVTLRGGLAKLKKLGFGSFTEDGLTGDFFTSGAEKAEFRNRYLGLRYNWQKVVGLNKRVANDVFDYLDGKVHVDFLKTMHGEKTVQVAKQMRSYLDTLLVMQNRHRAQFGEKPIKAEKNYVTHLFEDMVKDIKLKKNPMPDWLLDAIPFVTPKKASAPFLKTRKGAIGFQRDIWKALDAYTFGASQVVGDLPIRRASKIGRFITKQIQQERRSGKVSDVDWVGIKKNLNSYTKSLQGQPGAIDTALRGLVDPLNTVLRKFPGEPQIRSINDITDGMISLLYGTQMAFRPKLPLRNLGQHSLIIGQTGFKPMMWAITTKRTPEVLNALSKSKVLSSRGHAFGAETQALFGRSKLQRTTAAGLKAFKLADVKNVVDAFLSGYKQAKNNPSKYPDPIKRGDEVAGLTQYVYLPENRSDLARGFGVSKTLGRLGSVFTTWPSNWVEFNIASASNPETRKNLMKYWATSLTFSAVTAALGIEGAKYTGITSPLSLLQIAKGKLPVTGVAERPTIRAIEELSNFVDGDISLKELMLYTFE